MGQRADLVWHRESNLDAYDAVVIPGGFSYGDHLRTGAIARFSPVMDAVQRHADAGKPVIGICNGFQILCSRTCRGALMRNDSLRSAAPTILRPRTRTRCSRGRSAGQVLMVLIPHGEGNYYADPILLRSSKQSGASCSAM
jgi:phosphoribosylformylglycinamidine synthase